MLILIEESSNREERVHRLQGAVIRIGRVPGNDLVLQPAHISSKHARIRRERGRYLIADLDSTNGSFVQRGEERLLLGPKGASELALEAGDVLVLGDVDAPVRLRVELPAETAPTAGNTIVAARASAEFSGIVADDAAALQTLLRLVDALDAAAGREEVLDAVAQAALDAIPGAADGFVVAAEGAPRVLARAQRGAGIAIQPDGRICRQVVESQQALLFGQQSDALPAATLVARGLGSGIAAPLRSADGGTFGVLQVNCQPGRVSLGEAQLDVVALLAHHAAMALDRASLIERLRAAQRQLREENAYLRRRALPAVEIVAESPSMVAALAELERAADADVTVLLQGETGTGKEIAARFVHERSPRRGGLLVPVNCGALTETLLDSELFGHKKGAFTGATSDRKGVFEMAGGGTVFLDEVGETPLSLQVRLLRVLEESKVKRVGEAIEREVDARIVAATNRDLTQMVERGQFRRDLYYRLRVFPVCLPPLRERPEDIEPLARLFAARFAAQQGKRIDGVDPSLVTALRCYGFPGNVRELANEIERAVVRAEVGQPLTAELLSDEVLAVAPAAGGAGSAGQRLTLREQVARFEAELIRQCLARHGGRKAAAAEELGLTRQGLAKKIARLELK